MAELHDQASRLLSKSAPQQEKTVKAALAVVLVWTLASRAMPAHAQGSTPAKPAFATEVVTSDSLSLADVTESPDGRWLLFASSIRSGPSHLWVMPSGGGAPSQLTDGVYDDLTPVWFPSGRRVAFQSSRVHGVMTADIDPQTGKLLGSPKRVSLEDANTLDVSPDGSRIAYIDMRNRLRLIPSVGGPAVTLLDHGGAETRPLVLPRFSRDGREIYVSARDAERRMSMILRVPVSGGRAMTALMGPPEGSPWNISADPTHDRVVAFTPSKTSVLTLKGDTVAEMPPVRGGSYARISRDGRRLYKASSVYTSVVRALPTTGGKPIDVTNGKSYDYPREWSSDSKQLYSRIGDTSITKSKRGLYLTPLDGRAPRFIPIADNVDTALIGSRMLPATISADGRYWWFTTSWRPPFGIVAYDTKTGSAQLVTRTAMGIGYERGGFNGRPEVYYVEQRRGDGPFELHSLTGGESSNSLHKFSHLDAPWWFAIHRDRLAFGARVGDSTVLYTARLMGEEQRLMTVGGAVSDLSWSPDGTALAAVVSPAKSGSDGAYRVLFVQVSEDGRMGGAHRLVPTGPAWDLYWSPDSRSVLVLEEEGNTDHTRVIRVPMGEGQQPVSITPNEKRPFWDQYVSPDGRYTAIAVEKFGSSTLWSIDIDAAAKAWRAKGGSR